MLNIELHDYDFATDTVTESKALRKLVLENDQDALKYSIIGIIGYICSKVIVDYLEQYTKLTGSYTEGVQCRMVMKNRFCSFIIVIWCLNSFELLGKVKAHLATT